MLNNYYWKKKVYDLRFSMRSLRYLSLKMIQIQNCLLERKSLGLPSFYSVSKTYDARFETFFLFLFVKMFGKYDSPIFVKFCLENWKH